jgi:hypothetical protein
MRSETPVPRSAAGAENLCPDLCPVWVENGLIRYESRNC